VIKVAVSDQEAVQFSKPKPGLKDLALSAFSAIYQKTMLIMLDHLGRQPALNGRG
jgi:hypothetical protein